MLVEVLGVDWRTWLLPPGLVQTAGVDAIKAKFFDEVQNDGLGCVVIARNWQSDAPGRTRWPALFEKVSGVNGIERFDHRPAKPLLNPPNSVDRLSQQGMAQRRPYRAPQNWPANLASAG